MPKVPAFPQGSWLARLHAKPSNKVSVWLSEDYLVEFPIEVDINGRRGYVGPEDLGLSDALVADLLVFQRDWETMPSDEEDDEDPAPTTELTETQLGWMHWDKTGWRLVDRLRRELGPGGEVGWSGRERES